MNYESNGSEIKLNWKQKLGTRFIMILDDHANE